MVFVILEQAFKGDYQTQSYLKSGGSDAFEDTCMSEFRYNYNSDTEAYCSPKPRSASDTKLSELWPQMFRETTPILVLPHDGTPINKGLKIWEP